MFEIYEFVSYFLAVFYIMIGLSFGSRSYAMSEREGYSFISYGEKYSKTWWHRHTFNIFRAAILLICVTRLFYDLDALLGVCPFLSGSIATLFGVLFMLLGYSVVSYVAGFMNRDWYSGIAPKQHEQVLVTSGPFSRTRNPLFIGIMFGQFGFFLALPSVFSLICLLVGVVVIANQAKVEEAALELRFGESYRAYKENTPKWIK